MLNHDSGAERTDVTVAICSLLSPLLANKFCDRPPLFLFYSQRISLRHLVLRHNADMHIITVYTLHFVYVRAWLLVVDECAEWLRWMHLPLSDCFLFFPILKTGSLVSFKPCFANI